MPGESRGTLRAAPCACVELISSPPSLLPSSHPSVPSPSFAFPSAGSARGEYGVPRDLAPLPLRAHSPSSSSIAASLPPPLPLLYVFSPYLTPVYRRSLSFAVVSSSSSSLHGSFSFLRCCVLHSRYRHPLIKPLPPPSFSHRPLLFRLSVFISLRIFISVPSLVALASPSFSSLARVPLPSSFSRPIVGLSPHFTSRVLYSPIERPLIKLYFVKLLRVPRKFFGESRFHDEHARSQLHVFVSCWVAVDDD